jgi:Zn-dependent metalloprotease
MAQRRLQRTLLAASIGLALAAQASAAVPGQSDAIARLTAATGQNVQISFHAGTGTASFVRSTAATKLLPAALARATNDAAREAAALQFINSYGALFGVTDAASELVTARTTRDHLGNTHITHQQVYRGVPVFAGELKSHFDADGNLTAINGTFVPNIDVATTPVRSASEAAAAAVAMVRGELTRRVALPPSAVTPQLVVYREGLAKGVDGASRLAWRVEVTNRRDVRDFVFLDAISGKLIEKIAGIHDAKNRRAFDGTGATQPGPNYPATPFWVEGQAFPTGTAEADNMILASSDVYDLFSKAFGRDSYDGNGARMDSIFNRGDSCPNASWGGAYISFCPGTTTDDITAHEWGHAYTEYTHGLIYAWQPGALNEAYSDIWGETVDRINGRGGDTPDTARSVGVCAAITSPAQYVNVLAPAGIAGLKAAGTAAWGPQTFTLSGTVQGVDVGSASAGCAALPAGSLTGKIAFIDRGTCGFSVKALNAQNAGAVAAIIGNNTGGTVVLTMSVTAGSVPTIPTLSMTQNDGTALKAALATDTVSVSLNRAGAPGYNTVRWLMGEDSAAFGGAIRDMYNPTCYGNPGKVSDSQYSCASSDSGGVHNNSGVANHGYALLVDGGTYNGQTITGIGLTKAAHIYYRAQSVYQGPASGFPQHADALAQSCTDLTGSNLKGLTTGLPSGEIISADDCAQVAKTALAVEFRTPATQCNFQPLLAQSPPAFCAIGSPTVIAADNFDGGRRASLKWSLSTTPAPNYKTRDWGVVNNLPGGRPGYAMFVADPDIGTCGAGGDASSSHRLDSADITIPAGATNLRMSFDHYVATESGYDGGNVKVSVNGGAFVTVAAGDFVYNPYNGTLLASGNSNPLAGQAAFNGTDAGSVAGTWGRSIINLAPYAVPGDRVKLRFEFGKDCGGGRVGWYVDDVQVYRCTP